MNALFGYELRSEIPLSRQRPAPSHRGAVEVRRAEGPLELAGELVSWFDQGGAQIAVRQDGADLGLWCNSTGSFRMSASDRSITADPAGDLEWWEHRLGSTVIPLLLGEIGDLSLHAAAVAIEDRAIVICGESGAGKSTLATALALAGHTVLSEDGVVISGLPEQAIVWPGLDGVRVAAPTFARIVGDTAGPDVPGKLLRLQRGRPVAAVAGGAIVFLEPRVSGRLVIERVKPVRALPALTGHVLCPGRARLATSLRRSAALLDLLPAFMVALPDDLPGIGHHSAELVAAVSAAV